MFAGCFGGSVAGTYTLSRVEAEANGETVVFEEGDDEFEMYKDLGAFADLTLNKDGSIENSPETTWEEVNGKVVIMAGEQEFMTFEISGNDLIYEYSEAGVSMKMVFSK